MNRKEELAEFLSKVITARAGIRRKIMGIRDYIIAIEDKAKKDKIAFAEHCMTQFASKQIDGSYPEITPEDITKIKEILKQYER